MYEQLYVYQHECLAWLWSLREVGYLFGRGACQQVLVLLPHAEYPLFVHLVFLASHQAGMGGILGDDMGLGKTVQISAYINGLFRSRLAKRVLILAPLSVLPHWQRELQKWCPDVRVLLWHGLKGKKKQLELDDVLARSVMCRTICCGWACSGVFFCLKSPICYT